MNIHVKRFPVTSPVALTIEPEDRSFLVTVKDGDVSLYRKGEADTYYDVELPGASVSDPMRTTPVFDAGEALDYSVVPCADHGGGFIAYLNCRHIGGWGATEHEAVKVLLNYVVQLATAGCLDHTGKPTTHNKKRYEAVFSD